MKYLIAVDDCFLDAPGGMGRVAWDIATVMRERGHEAAMVSIEHRKGATQSSLENVEGMQIVRWLRPSAPSWHPRRASLILDSVTRAVCEHLGGQKWDIVHMHTPFSGVGTVRAIGPGPRYVYTLHSPIVLEQEINWARQGFVGRLKMLLGKGSLRRLEHEALAPTAVIHTLSQYSRSQVERYHDLGSRVRVIPHWRRPEMRRTMSKADARQRLGWPENETIFFTVRRLGPRYGLDQAIRALAPLLGPGKARFVLGGDGPWRQILEDEARASGAGAAIQFLGRVSDEQLFLAYQAADLFLLPTQALECFGLIILEAFAFGLPVLSSDACAIPELMTPIAPDFVFPAGDEAALRAKVQRFMSGQLVAPPAETLVRYVDEHFSRTAVVPKLVAMLEGASAN